MKGTTHRLGQLGAAAGPPIAVVVTVIQADASPGGGGQRRAVSAQRQCLEPASGALVVMDGLPTRLCAPDVDTACSRKVKRIINILNTGCD